MPGRPMVRPPRRIREDGYMKEDNIVDITKEEEILKAVFKWEFSRSRKVRVTLLSGPGEVTQDRKVL